MRAYRDFARYKILVNIGVCLWCIIVFDIWQFCVLGRSCISPILYMASQYTSFCVRFYSVEAKRRYTALSLHVLLFTGY